MNVTCLTLFEERVLLFPSQTALLVEGSLEEEISYASLDSLATSLASQLILLSSLRLSSSLPTPLISLLMGRNLSLIVSMLAVLKAGCAYVPIDPTFPPDRQSYIFTHSQVSLLLADEESYEEALALGVSLPPDVMVMDRKGKLLPRHPKNSRYFHYQSSLDFKTLLIESRAQQNGRERGGLQYVLYTSGSTGKPKGVMVTMHGVVNLVSWFQTNLEISSSTRILGLTTACFDISVLEIFLPLISGATLILAQSASQKDPFRLLDLMSQTRVNVMQATPTTFEMMLATGWKGDKNLHLLVIA